MNRSQANALVEAALKSGRIVQADHDMRLSQIKAAASDQDIDMVVRDLQPPAQMPTTTSIPPVTPGAPPATGQQPWPLVNYGPGQVQGQTAAAAAELSKVAASSGKWIGGIVGLVVVISVIVPIVGVIIGLVSAKDSFDSFGDLTDPVDETTYLPGQAPGENGVNLHTIDGFDAMVAGLEAETGGTSVFSAVIYPRYAVLEVPEGPTGKRYRNYYWDGHSMALQDFKSTTDDPRIDLATFDAGCHGDAARGRPRPDRRPGQLVRQHRQHADRREPAARGLRQQRLRRGRLHPGRARRHHHLREHVPRVGASGYRHHVSIDHPVVVMGVSGSGKSTVGAALAGRLRVPFEDADDLHPSANIAKMSRGEPLDDSDRYPWLELIGMWLVNHADGGVIACSALKRKYRDQMRGHLPRWSSCCSPVTARRSNDARLRDLGTSCRRHC